jgi:hypothetical protein
LNQPCLLHLWIKNCTFNQQDITPKFSFPVLETLHCSASNLHDSIFQEVLASAPNLKTLFGLHLKSLTKLIYKGNNLNYINVSKSNHLKEVVIQCANMDGINVSGCSSLEKVGSLYRIIGVTILSGCCEFGSSSLFIAGRLQKVGTSRTGHSHA